MSLKTTIKRHTFLLLSGLLVFVIAGGVGYGLSQSSQQLLAATIPAANSPMMLLIRLAVYTIIYVCWDIIVAQRIKSISQIGHSTNERVSFLKDFRFGVAVMIIAYEGILVQKLPAVLIASLF